MKNVWLADPLVWGHGPCMFFEVFLDRPAVFRRLSGKLDDLRGQAGEDRITISSDFIAALAYVLGR